MTPDFRNALTSAHTRLSLIRTRSRSISAACPISSKQAAISASSTHVVVRGRGCQMVDLGDRVMGTPVRAEPVRARQEVRLEDGLEHRLESGLDDPVGDSRDPQLSQLAADALGIITCRTSTGRNSPDFSDSRMLVQERHDPDLGLDPGHRGPVDPRVSVPRRCSTRAPTRASETPGHRRG